MRVFNQGCFYRVTVSAQEVYQWSLRWPCSGLACNSHSFTFDKQNGDLVDISHPGSEDGEALMALSGDAQAYGRKRLRLTD